MEKGTREKCCCTGDAKRRAASLEEDIGISLAETAMFRFKQLMAGRVSLRKYNGQVGKVMAYVTR
jgi:hypothetical protein